MKKSHPDEDKIPTLRDLVFPGDQELRRPPERERIEPRLESDGDAHSEGSPPALEQEHVADPFILLPEDELDWKTDQASESARMRPEAEAPPLPEPVAAAEDEASQEISDPLADEEIRSAITEPDTGGTDIDDGIQVEEEVSIEDLMTYFHHSRAPDTANLAPPPQTPPADPMTDAPAVTEQPDADTPTEQETIRAAVRSVLEQELDRLTDIVTDAVVARLRD